MVIVGSPRDIHRIAWKETSTRGSELPLEEKSRWGRPSGNRRSHNDRQTHQKSPNPHATSSDLPLQQPKNKKTYLKNNSTYHPLILNTFIKRSHWELAPHHHLVLSCYEMHLALTLPGAMYHTSYGKWWHNVIMEMEEHAKLLSNFGWCTKLYMQPI